MSSTAPCFVPSPPRVARLEVLFGELAELAGQRNAIDGRIVDIVAEIEREGLASTTGVKSVAQLVAWKLGVSPRNAETIVAIAGRAEDFPRCTQTLRDGQLSLDQVGVIAERGGAGSDAHYGELAQYATVTQLRTAVKLEPRTEPDTAPRPAPHRSITKTGDDKYTCWRITLPHDEAAKVDAALSGHRDALIADWRRDHGSDHPSTGGPVSDQVPPLPGAIDAFMRLVETSWYTEVARRPHGQHTTVIAHLDVDRRVASLHRGPLLSDDDRRFLLCDATCEVWFERAGRPIGAGRATRTVGRRLRRALEHRDCCCVVPGCGATRGLHAHHIIHWEDGGPTELDNLVLVCPYHHRAHHRGLITITGPAHRLVVTDDEGQRLSGASLARPPTTAPPAVPPYRGPTGEPAHWYWYDPYVPPPPTSSNGCRALNLG